MEGVRVGELHPKKWIIHKKHVEYLDRDIVLKNALHKKPDKVAIFPQK